MTDVGGEAIPGTAMVPAEPTPDPWAEAHRIVVDLLLVKPLYYRVKLEGDVGSAIEETLRNYLDPEFDTYCVGCKLDTPFRMKLKNVGTKQLHPKYAVGYAPPDLIAVTAVCQRKGHGYTYVFLFNGGSVIKIGQYPSLADLALNELKRFDSSLLPEDRAELGRALGLFAHDTAIGAFVYLRRVFERMIQRARVATEEASGPIEGFDGLRMDDRIAALKDKLPDRVVRNRKLFAMLSVGIHELTEAQCAAIFPVLKAVLFQMLEEEEHKRLAQKAEEATEVAFQTILADMAKPSGEA